MPDPTNPKPVIYRLNKRFDSLTSTVSNYDAGRNNHIGYIPPTIDGFTLQEDLLLAVATIQAQHEELKFLRQHIKALDAARSARVQIRDAAYAHE
jgi:hypothetical protein